jgi:hypothetical protein
VKKQQQMIIRVKTFSIKGIESQIKLTQLFESSSKHEVHRSSSACRALRLSFGIP